MFADTEIRGPGVRIREQERRAVSGGFEDAFWWAVAFTALAALLSLLLPGRPKPAETSQESALGRASA